MHSSAQLWLLMLQWCVGGGNQRVQIRASPLTLVLFVRAVVFGHSDESDSEFPPPSNNVHPERSDHNVTASDHVSLSFSPRK